MRAILAYITRGRYQAIIAATLLAALSPLFAPLYYFSGAIVGLATLRYGASEGAIVMAGTGVLFAVMAGVIFKSLLPAVLMMMIAWAPCLVLAWVLRRTVSQGRTLTLAGIGVVALVFVFHLSVNDAGAWWQTHLNDLMGQALSEVKMSLDSSSDILSQFSALIDLIAPIMTGLLLSGVLFGAIVMMLIARWWHALLDNPGGFGKEFRALRLDGRVAVATLAIVALAVLARDLFDGIGLELLCIAMVLYVFQGLAVAHAVVTLSGAWVGWIWALYVLAVLATPQMMVVLALLGLMDAAVNLRARVGRRGGSV